MASLCSLDRPPTSSVRVPRVMIVDDSAVARAALSRMVGEGGRYGVAGACASAAEALELLRRTSVDLILLDIEMPRTTGLSALPDLLRAARGAKVLIVSGTAADGAAHAVEALALGAADTLVKPAAATMGTRFADLLLAKLDELTEVDTAPITVPRAPTRPAYPFDVVAIGASTGGIHALTSVLRAIPPWMQRPIVVTQHLPSSFSAFFADQITAASGRICTVASECTRLLPGRIVVAPGDAHVVARSLGDGTAALRLSREPAATGNLPAVDPMFASLAAVYRERLLAVVLSGMGRDGLDGARQVRADGGTVVVQDRASSVVWGMPGTVAGAGLAHAVLSPDRIAGFIAANGRA